MGVKVKPIILRNNIIRYQKNNDSYQDFRILFMDQQSCVLFDIADDVAVDPKIVPIIEVEIAIERGEAKLLDFDPIIEHYLLDESKLTTSSRKIFEASKTVIEFLVYKDGKLNLDIFDTRKRKRLIKSTLKEIHPFGKKLSEKTILRKLRAYFRGGMVEKSLYPYLYKCGAPGSHHNSIDKKIGRKSELEILEGRLPPLYDYDELRMIFYKELEKQSGDEFGLNNVLDQIIKKYFTTGYEIRNGITEFNFVDRRLIPTYKQLFHFYRKEFKKDPIKFLKKKYGNRVYEKDKRPTLGGLANRPSGPGQLYLIDSTIADIYLVYTHDRAKIIGRPTLYIVIDQFSGMIVGFSITMNPASWISALTALDNAFSNKVEFCAEYGIFITDEMWSVSGLPYSIKGDRAELISKLSSQLTYLGIKISNTAPYRPDWKGLVESWIKIVNHEAQSIPGGITHPHKRGEKDIRLLACLTPNEFTKIIIQAILFYNNYHTIKNYPRSVGMLEDGIKCTPSILWRWGIENSSGDLRAWDREDEMYNLLPRGSASITEDGYLFKGKIFHSGLTEEQTSAVIAKTEGRKKIDVVYNPRNPEIIYAQLYDRKRFTPLYLSEDFSGFRGLHEIEWDFQDEIDRYNSNINNLDEQMARINKDQIIEEIVAPALIEAKESRGGMNKSAQVRLIRENQKLEIEKENMERPLIQSETITADKLAVPTIQKFSNWGYISRPKKILFIQDDDANNNGD